MVREAWLDEGDVTVVGTTLTHFLLGGCVAGDTERCSCEVCEGVRRMSPSIEGTGEGVADMRAPPSGVLRASSINSLARVIDRCVPYMTGNKTLKLLKRYQKKNRPKII